PGNGLSESEFTATRPNATWAPLPARALRSTASGFKEERHDVFRTRAQAEAVGPGWGHRTRALHDGRSDALRLPLRRRPPALPGGRGPRAGSEGIPELPGARHGARAAEVRRRRVALPALDRGRIPPSRALPESRRGLLPRGAQVRCDQGLQSGPLLEPELRAGAGRASKAGHAPLSRRAGSPSESSRQRRARKGLSPARPDPRPRALISSSSS